MTRLLSLLSICICFAAINAKTALNLDAFFNYTNIGAITLSPSGEYLLIQTTQPSWDSHSFQSSLWLYQIAERRKKLIANQISAGVKFQWSPTGKLVAFLMSNSSVSISKHNIFRYPPQIDFNADQNIYLYSIETDQIRSISVGNDIITALTWAENDSSLYYVTIDLNSNENEGKWKDVIRYRADYSSIIRQINVNSANEVSSITKDIVKLPFLISELVFSSITRKLVFNSFTLMMENTNTLQIYSVNLNNVSLVTRLTNQPSNKIDLQLTNDEKNVLFLTFAIGSSDGSANFTQNQLYAVDLTNESIERWTSDFNGSITGYTTNSNGGIYFLGQMGINTYVYSQASLKNNVVLQDGFNGSYLFISSSANSIAASFTSFSKALEVYFTNDINKLKSAVQITNENSQYDEIDLPQAKSYWWKNNEDNQMIEGILYYPPGKFEQKNLPLLVLIHGGPTGADMNYFVGGWYSWAPLAAANGWAVFQPNYRGSTGYGDEFANAIRYQPVTTPQNDILSGVDQLIADGIADKTKLAVGGYSYGGIMTNWLITQTTRFNVALSGAGSVDQASFWGTTDIPIYIADLLGNLPWKSPSTYQNQSAIYHFDRIRTPTHIVAGTADIRVPWSQSLILERSLRYLNIPVQLLLLPNEGHTLGNDPWHGKIKVEEELQWLKQYGLNSIATFEKK